MDFTTQAAGLLKKIWHKIINYIKKTEYSYIGIDFGSTQIKAVQFKWSSGELSMHRSGIFPVPPGIIDQGRVKRPDLLSELIKEINRNLGFYKKPVNISVGNQHVVHRDAKLPTMEVREIPGALCWEAEKHIMLSPEKIVTDYAFDRYKEDDGNKIIELLLVAVPKDVVNGYLEAVAGAGFSPDIVETEPFALCRAVNYYFMNTPVPAGESLLVIDVGGDVTTFLIMEDNEYQFFKSINIGVNHFINAGESSELLFSSEPFLREEVRNLTDNLIEYLHRYLNYYQYRVKDIETETETEVKRLYLCGGGSYIKGLADYIGRKMELETMILNFAISGNTGGDNNPGLLGVAAGLALRGCD